MTATPDGLERRFWAKVTKSDGCWLWTSARATNGYGKFGDWKNRKTWAAHRLAWTLTNGEIPAGLEVCHRCNVKLCVRPGHLYLAPHAINMADAARDGLYWTGEDHLSAKLSEHQVREIRRLRAEKRLSFKKLGLKFGIAATAAEDIVKHTTWRRVA